MFTSVLSEQMEGWFSLDSPSGKPPEKQGFVLRLCAPAPGNNPMALVRPFSGTVSLANLDKPIECDGILELQPSGPAYEFRFSHPSAGELVLSGKKTYSINQLVNSMTICPLKVHSKNATALAGSGEMRYNQPLWQFPLESFKMLAPRSVSPMVKAFSNTPFCGSQCKHKAGQGHYESWFIRANHPERPQALWIRYTQFIPALKNKERENGELWAIWFDETDSKPPVTAYQAFPLGSCEFSKEGVDVRIADNQLSDQNLRGSIHQRGQTLSWDLDIERQGGPLLLLPEPMYVKDFPKAKSLVLDTNCRFSGKLILNGKTIELDNWRGSLNHNWGKQHTDEYAWGQVAGFDEHDEVFLECATARIKLGPVMSPAFSPVVIKLGHETLRFNQLSGSLLNTGQYAMGKDFKWQIQAKNHRAKVSIEFTGPASQFASLDYRNPPGGIRRCLNSKIARCTLTIDDVEMGHREYISSHSAAFEILTDIKNIN